MDSKKVVEKKGEEKWMSVDMVWEWGNQCDLSDWWVGVLSS